MIIHDTRRWFAVAGLLVLAALFSLLVLPPLSTPTVTATTAGNPPARAQETPEQCGDLNVKPHFYTYHPREEKESRHAFGPAARTTHTTDELRQRLCGYRDASGTPIGGDWALLRALQGMIDGTDPNHPLTMWDWQDEVRDFTDRIQWDRARIVREGDRHGRSYTLYMTGKPGQQPTIHSYKRTHLEASTFLLISVKQKSGDIGLLKLRLECGFQPEFLHPDRVPKSIRLHQAA